MHVFVCAYVHMFVCALQCGVIECVPDSKSRDQLGKATQVSLLSYFHGMYGDDDSLGFQKVKDHAFNKTL